MIDRLHTEKQKDTIHSVILFLKSSESEVGFGKLRKLIYPLEAAVGKAAEEYKQVKTAVVKLEDSPIKEKVLTFLNAKTKIQKRTQEEKEAERRGAPTVSIEETKKRTEDFVKEVVTIAKKRDQKKKDKEPLDEGL